MIWSINGDARDIAINATCDYYPAARVIAESVSDRFGGQVCIFNGAELVARFDNGVCTLSRATCRSEDL